MDNWTFSTITSFHYNLMNLHWILWFSALFFIQALAQEMDRVRGYQTLAMLLKKKRHLLNAHILHLTFALVGTVGDQLPRGSGE